MCNRSLLDFDPMVILKAHKFWKNSRRTWGFLLTFLDRLTANYYLKAVNDRDRINSRRADCIEIVFKGQQRMIFWFPNFIENCWE